MTREQRAHALTLIARAHLRALQRRNIKPPQKLFKLYPHLKSSKRVVIAKYPGLPCETVLAIYAALVEANGRGQKAIAERFGLKPVYVSRIWTGANYDRWTGAKAARVKERGGAP